MTIFGNERKTEQPLVCAIIQLGAKNVLLAAGWENYCHKVPAPTAKVTSFTSEHCLTDNRAGTAV